MPTITLNGKPHPVRTPITLVELLTSLEIDRRTIAVCLQDGDSIEVVRMVGGG